MLDLNIIIEGFVHVGDSPAYLADNAFYACVAVGNKTPKGREVGYMETSDGLTIIVFDTPKGYKGVLFEQYMSELSD